MNTYLLTLMDNIHYAAATVAGVTAIAIVILAPVAHECEHARGVFGPITKAWMICLCVCISSTITTCVIPSLSDVQEAQKVINARNTRPTNR